MTIRVKYPIKRKRALLRMAGIDPRDLSAADINEGYDAARRVLQCGCGADSRRLKADADWQAFVRRVRSREGA